jgi:hypothetical protein
MKILRNLAIGAIAFICVKAFAQEASAPPQQSPRAGSVLRLRLPAE